MAVSTGARNPSHGSSLEHLIEEINFQRAKEMRQLLKDDSGFVMLHGTGYWTDLFVRHFLMEEDRTAQESDDLLFFIRKRHLNDAKKPGPKYETLLEVQRRASSRLPLGDPEIDWEETIYANLIIHRFDYYVTLAVCCRTSAKELQVLRRHTERVWASPSRRLMSDKGTSEEITYPNICFMLDNFDQAFTEIVVGAGEMVSVELVARDRGAALQSVLFLGSVRYDALRRVYDARSSLTARVAQRVTFGLYSAADHRRTEFVRVRGPMGKGHAELAVTRPPGVDCGSPTASEPASPLVEPPAATAAVELQFCRAERRASAPSGSFQGLLRAGLGLGSPEDPEPCPEDPPEDPEPDRGLDSGTDTRTGDSGHGVRPSLVDCTASPTSDGATGSDSPTTATAARPEDPTSSSSRTAATSCRGPCTDPAAAAGRPDPGDGAETADTPVEHGGGGGRADGEAAPGLGPGRTDCGAGYDDDADSQLHSPGVGTKDPPGLADPPATSDTAETRTLNKTCGKSSDPSADAVAADTAVPPLQSPPAAPAAAAPRRASWSAASPRSAPRPQLITPGMLYRRACGQERCRCARTPDGTVVHYRCPAQQAFLRRRELDSGGCAPLWTVRGLSQSLQARRGPGLTLNTCLTYVMLPWHTIITDLIAKENRQDPILSF